MALVLEVSENMTLRRKLDTNAKVVNRLNRSKLKIDGRVDLSSS